MARASSSEIRLATVDDVEEIAAAHLDSIRSVGSRYYDEDVVRAWSAHVRGDLYARAMAAGEVFFIAADERAPTREVLGFSSHRRDDDEHRTAVYVRGSAARRGIGSALFRAAESSAIAAGATSIHVAASLAAVKFYEANGFEIVEPGVHAWPSGQSMACMFMRKRLSRHGS